MERTVKYLEIISTNIVEFEVPSNFCEGFCTTKKTITGHRLIIVLVFKVVDLWLDTCSSHG